ncbi:unnamed protein product [Boreogadus saida]
MLLLRDHYKAAVDEKVGALLLLPDPIWRPNFAVALAWAQRHFGQRLRPETSRSHACARTSSSSSSPPHGLARADAEREDAPADARDPASPAPSFSTPTVTLARPTRHPSTGSTGPRLTSSLRNPRLSAN